MAPLETRITREAVLVELAPLVFICWGKGD